MPPHHLIGDGLRDVFQGEEALFLRDHGVENDLQQQVAQLLPEVPGLPRLCQNIDPPDHLRRLLDAGGLKALVRLRAVPGTAVLGAELLHYRL